MSRLQTTSTIVLCSTIALLVGTFVGIYFQRNIWNQDYKEQIYGNKLLYTIDLLDQKYVDSLSRDSLYELVIPDLLSKLDPHSEYIPARDLTGVNETLAGKFDGIGVMFNMMTDTALITNVISGGPCSKVGVMPGDKIMTVNDTIIAGRKMDSNRIVSLLRGKKNTTVKLGLKRGLASKLIHINVTRGEIPMRSVEAAFMVKPEVGFIKVTRFAATTYNEFSAALDKLTKQGAKKIIIDLRDNGGGFLDQAIFMANEFLEAGQGIVYTEGAKSPRRTQKADGKGRYKDIPLAILIGPETASASEIFAGAMQDNDRAEIIGLRSFGKGLIQEQIEYPDGSAARLTIAKYYTPLGRSIQKPYHNSEKSTYQMELYTRLQHSELLNKDSILVDSTKKVITPKGKILYGGGGIHPDVFVGIDTTSVSPFFRRLVEGNYIFKFATKFTEDNREALNKVTTFSGFEKIVEDQKLLYDFLAWADRSGVKVPSEKELQASRQFILAQLKAYIGRNTPLEDNALYYYFYPIDNTMKRSVEYITDVK